MNRYESVVRALWEPTLLSIESRTKFASRVLSIGGDGDELLDRTKNFLFRASRYGATWAELSEARLIRTTPVSLRVAEANERLSAPNRPCVPVVPFRYVSTPFEKSLMEQFDAKLSPPILVVYVYHDAELDPELIAQLAKTLKSSVHVSRLSSAIVLSFSPTVSSV